MVPPVLVRSLLRRAAPAALLTPLVLAACGGGGADEPSPVPASVEALSSGPALTGTVGAELAAPVRVRVVGAGARPVGGATVSWTAAGGGTATPTSSVTDRDGVASTSWRLGGTAGAQQLTATVSGGAVSGVLVATAAAGRAASVRVAGDTVLALVPGVTVALGAVALDRFGNALATPVVWSSADGAVATVDAAGRLVTRAPGTVVVEAVSDTARARVTVRVSAQSALSVTRISPEPLVAGGTLTIEGAGFGEGASAARVQVAGVTAAIVEATPTRIRATVPALEALPCLATGGGAVTVLRQGAAGTTDSVRTAVALPTTATRRSLRVGESVALLTAADARCTQLEGGGRYIVSVFNTSASGDSSVSAQLRGTPAGTTLAARASLATTASGSAAALASRAMSPESDRVARADDVHRRQLEWERALGRRSGSPLAGLRAERARRLPGGLTVIGRARRSLDARPATSSSVGAAAAAAVAVGDTVAIGVFAFPVANCAAQPAQVRARVAYVGRSAVMYEDVANPNAGRVDAIYRQVGQEVDDVIIPMLQRNFGDPLAMDAQLDRDGKIAMLFSRQVNENPISIAGFITQCNLFPRSQSAYAGSNEMELFYVRAPSEGDVTGATWRYQLRATIAHELKHLAAYVEKIKRAAGGVPNYEEIWLEESSARLAEELYARTMSGARWRGNSLFAPTVGCEQLRCDDRPLAMSKHWEVLHLFYSRVGTLSPLFGSNDQRATFYASGWSLLRWALDHYGGTDEAAFLRALTLEPTLTGVANLAARTGRPPAEMLADWGLSMYVDDAPGLTPARAQLTQPSWNTRDLLRGLNASNPTTYPGAFPLAVRPLTFGTFLESGLQLRGWSTAFFELSGPSAAPQLLELGADGGGPLPATLRMAIVRVE